MKAFLCRWLPIFFGCHCRPDRSFRYRGRPFPICARCTGELVGMIAAAAVFGFFRPAPWAAALTLIPLVIDGFVQRQTSYESTNPRRFWTGCLFGYGFLTLIFMSLVWVYQLGRSVGLAYFR